MGSPQSVTVFHAKLLFAALISSLTSPATSVASKQRSFLNLEDGDTRAGQDRSDVYIDAMMKGGPPSEADTMQYLLRTLGKFKKFAEKSGGAVEARHNAEEERLEAGLKAAKDEGTSLALQQSVTANAESLLETQRVYKNMVNLASTMTKFLEQANTKGAGCENTKCGLHATCTDTTLGAQCICNEGYVGNGKNCAPPPEFMPHHLLFEGPGGLQTKARDINVAIFGKNQIAIVFADASRNDRGRTVIGYVREAGMALLGPPEPFTVGEGKAYSPVVVGTEDRRIMVTWRDENQKGLCWMRAAGVGTTNVRGAEYHLAWGKPVNFCRSLSHKMSVLPVPGNRAIVLYSDQVKATQHSPAEPFGNSMFVQIGKDGSIASLGNFRFASFAVCRLEVTKLTPKTFVIAARASQAVDEMDTSKVTRQEAMAVFGEVSGDDLVFDPNVVNLEPEGKNIWARGISLIAPNTFAYAYQRGTDQRMMLGVVHVNETNHKMEIVHKPTKIRDGFSPYVSMLNVPYTASDPHTLTYYNGLSSAMVNVCSWDPEHKRLTKCEDFAWLAEKVNSVSGVQLGGGKAFMVFAPESGIPFYGVFGLSKK